MTMLGSSGTDDLPLDVLWEDGELILLRGRGRSHLQRPDVQLENRCSLNGSP
jgi:hypothetical protein